VRSYDLLALLLVLAIPLSAMGLLGALVAWARDSVARSPVVGALGVVLTVAALANLLIARACGDGTNRPIVGLAVGDAGCQRVGLEAFGLVLLVVVTTAVVVRLGELRR